MTANELTKQAIERLALAGFCVWRTNAGYVKKNVKLAPKGTPDIIGYGPTGRFVGIEVKVGRDKIRDSQREWFLKAANAGAFTAIITETSDFDELIEDYNDPVLW